MFDKSGFLKVPSLKIKIKGENMSASCPISTKRVDANMLRAISFQVSLFVTLLLVTQDNFFALVLLFDFTVRALRLTQLSPFHLIGRFVLSGWGVAPKLCDESPKRFALYLGLVTSLILVVLFAAGLSKVATVIAIILLVCALLETVFDFCIGCKIYYALQVSKNVFNI